jgi:hypothetical protein
MNVTTRPSVERLSAISDLDEKLVRHPQNNQGLWSLLKLQLHDAAKRLLQMPSRSIRGAFGA